MGKALVIVESPSKAGIINGYLGDDYVVRASVGHVRDLPEKASSKTASKGPRTRKTAEDRVNALFDRMGVNPLKGWAANYQIMPDKEKVVEELRSLAAKCDKVYLATDLDREGEAIAWHLKELLSDSVKDPENAFLRVRYPEITRAAIQKAFKEAGAVNMDLVNAQQTRRFLDRVVGFMVSPLLWEKVGRGLSAGRVQSVAVALIVDREREIKAFVPEEYWTVGAETLTPGEKPLNLSLATKGKSKVHIKNKEEAESVLKELYMRNFVVSKVEERNGSAHAPAPFTTSTLQQTANQRLGFSVKRTMIVAQKLYESGHITYMRTDSVNLSEEAVAAARKIIKEKYGDAYLPKEPNRYNSGGSAQEAHEAIRPSHPDVRKLTAAADRDMQRLYDLIFARYLACQMTEQQYRSASVSVNAGEYVLRATGKVETFPGFRAALGTGIENTFLPEVHEGDVLKLIKLVPARHFTQPPARFSEAALVKELEKDGIGRPSTYASIINTIQERGYVRLERNRFFATKMGEIVTDRLRFSFANLMDCNFTASMEKNLDEIAAGRLNWIENLNLFYRDFYEHLLKASAPAEEGGMPDNRIIETDIVCPKCGKYHMGVQTGRTGTFLSCLGYHDPDVKAKDRCKCTVNLRPVEEDTLPPDQEMNEAAETDRLLKSKRCPKCGAAMDAFLADRHNKIYLCSNAPVCDGYVREQGNYGDDPAFGPSVVCERCGSLMEMKEGRFGRYMLCSNESCGNKRKILKNGEVASPKEDPVDLPELPCKAEGAHYVLRDGESGIFLAAHNFPKVRETRPVKVEELQRFRDRISPKFYYLADGPAFDPDGNPVTVRFSRKTKSQYLCSETPEGKATGWIAVFDGEEGVWKASTEKKSSASVRSSSAKAKKTATAKKSSTAKSKKTSTAKKSSAKKTSVKK